MIGQVLHILGKDVRRLRWELAGCLAVTLLNGWVNGDNDLFLRPWSYQQNFRLHQLLPVLMGATLIAQWFLTVAAIHGEVIPGVRQFWLTRPYRRWALLAAKLAFIALFVELPALAADLITLVRAGAGPGGCWGAVLWKAFLHFAVLVVPAVAVATVTTNLAQVALAGVGLVLLATVMSVFTPGGAHGLVMTGGLGWLPWLISVAVGGLAISAIIVWHYFRRRQTAAIVLICLTQALIYAVPSVLTRPRAFDLQARIAREPGAGSGLAMRPALERGRYVPVAGEERRWGYSGRGVTQTAIPIDVSSPRGLETWAELVEASYIDEETGARMPPGPRSTTMSWLGDGKSWLVTQMPAAEYVRFRGRRFRIHVDAAFTLLRPAVRQTIPLREGEIGPVGTFGVCSVRTELPQLHLFCREPFGPRHILRGTLRDREIGTLSKQQPWIGHGAGYGPVHQSLGITGALPVFHGGFQLMPSRPGEAAPWDLGRLKQTDVELTSFDAVDHVRRTVRFDGLRLDDYEIVVDATRF